MSRTQGDDPNAPVLVIGAGQAGLSTGYFLQEFDVPFSIVAADERVGDTWRNRWDSLRLFTPAFYNHLPGMDFPADDPGHLPTKDEVADYLEAYAERFDLPVELGTRVTDLRRSDGESGFVVTTDSGELEPEHVVVATGPYDEPDIPEVAEEVPDGVFTCHSSEYRNASQLRDGDILVVGAGNSGTQIATELADDDRTGTVWLVGPDRGTIPRSILGRDFYRWAGPTILRVRRTSVIGRRLHDRMARTGDPVFSNEHEAMEAAGVERITGRITSMVDGSPATADGEAFDVSNIVWCTGFRPGFDWIDLDVFDEDGHPRHERGVVTDYPELYFVGLQWLYRPNSSLLGGVGRDAEHVAAGIRDEVV